MTEKAWYRPRTWGSTQEEIDAAEKAKALAKSAETYAEESIDKAKQERSDASTAIFTFPTDLNEHEDSGYPYVRFGVRNLAGETPVSIYLHHPPNLVVGDSVNVGAFDMGTLKGGFDVAMAAYQNKAMPNVTAADTMAVALLAKDKYLTPGASIDKITSNAALQAGVATNPYTRNAYESTNIRAFSFNFKLVAANKAESDMALNIERTFRKFLYPKRAGSIALIYPPLFDIAFYIDGQKNSYLPNIKPCYLVSLETAINETSGHMHASGAPVEVSLSLGFQEERALIRQDLYENDDSLVELEGFSQISASDLVNVDDSAVPGD